MLAGTADPKALAEGGPRMTRLDASPLVLDDVETLQVFYELPVESAQQVLPPALHPTVPAMVSWLVQRVPESPWGGFSVAQLRLGCRSGVRPRGFLLRAVVDNEAAADALSDGWGYRTVVGEVRLRRFYDEIRAEVGADGALLELAMRDPEPLGTDYLQYVAGMHLAETDRGVRLVQVDPDYAVSRSERGLPVLLSFDAEAWGAPTVEPAYPVSASFSVGRVTLPRLRFLCRPEVWAFEGTEAV